MDNHRIYKVSVASVYPHYVTKVGRKGRTQSDVDEVIRLLTGYSQSQLEALLADGTDFETFFAEAPALNPARLHMSGSICGIKVEEMPPSTMREIRYLDKLVDDLCKVNPTKNLLLFR